MKMIKVAIADDHTIVREGLKQILELDENITVVGEASNGKETLEMLKSCKPDILLLDINMPVMSGLDVLENLRLKSSRQKVIILTIHNEFEYLQKAVQIGVDGYILKDSSSTVIRNAIFTVMDGNRYIDAQLSSLAKESTDSLSEASLKAITKRERQVLQLIAAGMLNKEIAIELDISEKTVKNHISSLFRKINVSDRTQAAVFAIKKNLVDIWYWNWLWID